MSVASDITRQLALDQRNFLSPSASSPSEIEIEIGIEIEKESCEDAIGDIPFNHLFISSTAIISVLQVLREMKMITIWLASSESSKASPIISGYICISLLPRTRTHILLLDIEGCPGLGLEVDRTNKGIPFRCLEIQIY